MIPCPVTNLVNVEKVGHTLARSCLVHTVDRFGNETGRTATRW